jgi:hypothetical protein
MKRRIVVGATIIFGIVPATFLLLWVVVFLLAALAGPFEDIEVEVTIVWWRVALFFLTAAAAIIGYVALLHVLRRPTTLWTVMGLLAGVAANLHGIQMAWDLNSYAMKQWSMWYWFISPMVVALAYIAAYLVQRGRHGGRTGEPKAA